MVIKPPSLKSHFVYLAYQEGVLSLKGNDLKAGPDIEKYLGVFREVLGQKDPNYLNPKIGYDWCCAYVYYLLKQTGVELNIRPLLHSNWMLGAVRTWYLWALQEEIFLSSQQESEPGDLVLFDALIENVELDHIGIIIESKKNFIITSEGNYHNCSGIFTRDKKQNIRGYIRL